MVQQMYDALKQTCRADPELFVHVMQAANIERSPIDFAIPELARLNWTSVDAGADGTVTVAADHNGARLQLTLVPLPGGKFRVLRVDQVH